MYIKKARDVCKHDNIMCPSLTEKSIFKYSKHLSSEQNFSISCVRLIIPEFLTKILECPDTCFISFQGVGVQMMENRMHDPLITK